MKSWFVEFTGPGAVRVAEEDVAAPGPGEVLCRSTLSLISPGTELACLRGEFDPGSNWEEWVRYPFRPGYSMAGVVAAVGEGVTGLRPGDRVQSYAPHQEFVTLKEGEARPLPAAVPDEEAVWVPLVVTAAAGAARAAIAMGETVVVLGLGPVGQLVVQYAVAHGAARVVAIDPDARRLDLALAGGATDVLAMPASEARPALAALTGGAMADVVFEVTGGTAVLARAVRLARPLGRVVLLGDTPTPSRQMLGPGVVSDSLTILGAHAGIVSDDPSAGPLNRDAVTELYFRRLASGAFRTAAMIAARVSPLEAVRTYEGLSGGGAPAGAICFDWRALTHD
ncbi:chlorophyll synthesis pathway protein BchC [Spongiactinospora rosea]|uniref:Chlorophyll synthesis pathway protein BchC n=1 Tax=Spongiactinospora rosea TaxID=2248750 RepID=A0A366LZB1_9ACTN|nr:zinc-binding dehydrogenase [Spongiactinospora rosea]RBQ18910.1 chlorophyll synthesis pathway protein BchC [Spongiactinospora rosea]